MRILGIDPGSRLTGYGCIDWEKGRITHIANGTLRLSNTGGKAVIPLEERLLSIYKGLTDVIQDTRPDIMVVEKVFFAKNAVSALKLGQARGAVILTGMIHDLTIVEYSPTEVKAAVVGHGQADKDQVARMVQLLIGGDQKFETADASDALALAICHAHSSRYSAAIATKTSAAQAYAQALRESSGKRKKKGNSLAEALAHVTSGRRQKDL